jgi:hypothetical protein
MTMVIATMSSAPRVLVRHHNPVSTRAPEWSLLVLTALALAPILFRASIPTWAHLIYFPILAIAAGVIGAVLVVDAFRDVSRTGEKRRGRISRVFELPGQDVEKKEWLDRAAQITERELQDTLGRLRLSPPEKERIIGLVALQMTKKVWTLESEFQTLEPEDIVPPLVQTFIAAALSSEQRRTASDR